MTIIRYTDNSNYHMLIILKGVKRVSRGERAESMGVRNEKSEAV